LLSQFATVRPGLSLETLVVRAAARALQDLDLHGTIHLEGAGHLEGAHHPEGCRQDSRALGISDAVTLSLGALQARLDGPAAVQTAAVLSLRSIGRPGIRAVSLPVLPGHAMRLILSLGEDISECLLCFDIADVTEETAIDLLSHIRADFDVPLRLFA
jgi:hypothetical protein